MISLPMCAAGGGSVPWPHGDLGLMVHSTSLDMRTVLLRLLWYTRVPANLFAHIARVVGRHVQLQAMVVMLANNMNWYVCAQYVICDEKKNSEAYYICIFV